MRKAVANRLEGLFLNVPPSRDVPFLGRSAATRLARLRSIMEISPGIASYHCRHVKFNRVLQMHESGRRASEILANARRNARKQDDFSRGGFHFTAIWDHILESQCAHANLTANGDSDCSRCLFERSLRLPELPEMVFPKNTLIVDFIQFPGSSISFSALEALKMVSSDTLPDVQVAPSSVWQEARQGMTGRMAHPFDWTFTSKYAGSVQNCTVEVTNDPIDLERLKRQEPIGFYAQVTLYEDELADHGTAQMSVRIRVMPDFFFVLMRFYLRIDRVLVRVCDTRLVGDNGKDYVIREWSLREAKVADLQHLPPEVLLDGNQVWASLPVVEMKNEKITPISSVRPATLSKIERKVKLTECAANLDAFEFSGMFSIG
ncbi:unnamed protein product [Cylicocyclus nassatus]|uniref:TIP41-like protein n=1 Tax=Cylicocyclus nassatus TaxID=53992 RepID=A0AA36H2D1_CYLNA|nr:unnamed protein product [Cylicocyclus nassatus]